jgi:hypothetical protein
MSERCPDHCEDEAPWGCACMRDRIESLDRALADMTAERDALAAATDRVEAHIAGLNDAPNAAGQTPAANKETS